MGIFWKSTMPLLSTLAALVIIVHSAEEEMNRGYRRDLRPRPVDTASYEQPWKAIDVVPYHQPTRPEAWMESSEEVPLRRRPVRKRKRRPLSYPDNAPQERHQESLQGAYTDFHDETIDPPKRRRKRPDHMNYHLTEHPPIGGDVHLRKRGLRKKRPDYDDQLVSPADEVETKYEEKNYMNKPFDYDYLSTGHNTEITSKMETNTTPPPKNVENGSSRINISKSTIGESESESIVSFEDHSEVLTRIIEDVIRKETTALNTVNPVPNSDNNSDITVTIPKVQNLKLGIIFNGKEHSYLPVHIPSEDTNSDHNEVQVTQANIYRTDVTNKVPNTDYNGKKMLKTQKNVSVFRGLKYKQPINDLSYGRNVPNNRMRIEVSLESNKNNLSNAEKEMSNKSLTKSTKLLFIPNDRSEDFSNKNNIGNTGKEIYNENFSTSLKKLSNPHEDSIYGDKLAHKFSADNGSPHFLPEKPNIGYRYKETNNNNFTSLVLESIVPYINRNENTQKAEKIMYDININKSKPKVATNVPYEHYTVNNIVVNNKKTHDIPTTTQKFLLAYGIFKNLTDKINKLEESSYVYKPKKDIFPKIKTKTCASLIGLGHENNKLHCIICPITLTKFIAIYYYLENDSETNNFESELGLSDSGTNLSLPIYEEENVTEDQPENGEYTPMEEILAAKIAKQIVSRNPSEFINSLAEIRNNNRDIKNSRKYSSYLPKKWLMRTKRIDKVDVLNLLQKEENLGKELIPGESQESEVLEPTMLKQLLKRSNGSSLSEILQRHNLSLSDLLQGRNEAISVLNAGATYEPQESHDISMESNSQLNGAESKYPIRRQTLSKERPPPESSSDEDTKGFIITEHNKNEELVSSKDDTESENQPKISTKRRFPTAIRRKLRMRPTLNSTLKAQLSRDLIALSARKYAHNNKNVTKSREWKDIVPMMPDRSKTEDDEKYNEEVTESEPITTDTPADTTTSSLKVSNSSYSLPGGSDVSKVKDNEVVNLATTTTEATTTITIEVLPDEIMSEIEKPKITPIVRPSTNNSTFRRQAFNNRLKRKRLKQKSSTTENPSDDLMRNFLGMANLVSASQFIERTQKPLTTIKMDNTEYVTELEDFLTTQTPAAVDSRVRSTLRFTTSTTARSLSQTSSTSTTEQTAKFEIQEILNDKMTKERLAKILRERNMTLNELVNHRERGSSHVHLADIFHNASKEPNPPEPFLTKSSIEPISKETYPLRAILEANTYETTTRMTSSQADQKNIQIPVVMDFKNNVNENGESMGIISLFNKLAGNEITIDKTEIQKDSHGTPYVSSVISVNATNANDSNDTREGRVLGDSEHWNELLTFMKTHNISTFEEDLQTLDKGDTERESIEDLNGDDLMLLNSLQQLQNLESNIASDEISDERRENFSEKPGILNKLPNNTKSVAIATASILGLAAILFLLTYTAFKWKQQRNKLRKKESFCDGPIPSPVFENRKGHKNNCSSRSISPMISNTNIYMSTLESNGKESPDYMWNSLRKPFQ